MAVVEVNAFKLLRCPECGVHYARPEILAHSMSKHGTSLVGVPLEVGELVFDMTFTAGRMVKVVDLIDPVATRFSEAVHE